MPYVRKTVPKKLKERSRRSTTFTKRRAGLFAKAAELCLVSNAQIAVLVGSINEKHGSVYSFGHSSVDNVLDTFLNNTVPAPVDNQIRETGIKLYNQRQRLKERRDKGKADDSSSDTPFWLELEKLDLEDRSIDDLNSVIEKLTKLKEDANKKLMSCSNDSIVTLADPDEGRSGNMITNNHSEEQSNNFSGPDALIEDPMHNNRHYDCSLCSLGVDNPATVNYAAGPSNSTPSGFNAGVRNRIGECSKKNDE
ncbi:hypothetical protein ACFE04_030401 [Oxalis oulophora]